MRTPPPSSQPRLVRDYLASPPPLPPRCDSDDDRYEDDNNDNDDGKEIAFEIDAAVAARWYSDLALEEAGMDTGLVALEILGYLLARRVTYSFRHRNYDNKDDNFNNNKDVKDGRRFIVSLPGVL